jgi:thiopurine S-methyltransferase
MTNDPDPASGNSQDNPLWLQLWRDDQTAGFHQLAVNPLLARFWSGQKLKRGSRVLVPLCGKSLDMLWLAGQGHQVVGVELSPVAVKAFFSENGLKATKRRSGGLTCWQSGAISIWCGDFFSLRRERLGHFDAVFDRAALTALPEAVRKPYVAQLRTLIEADTPVFLLCVEDVTLESGQSASHIDSEILALYAEYFEINLRHSQRVEGTCQPPDQERFFVDSKVYQLSQLDPV